MSKPSEPQTLIAASICEDMAISEGGGDRDGEESLTSLWRCNFFGAIEDELVGVS